MNTDETAQLLRELEALIDDFKTLRLSQAKGEIRTDRQANLSRSPIKKPHATDFRLWDKMLKRYPVALIDAEGICGVEQLATTAEDFRNASIFYTRTGQAFTNIAGESLVVKSGWESWHRFFLAGEHVEEVKAAIERANVWAKRRQAAIKRILFSDRLMAFGNCCWPDIVLEIAAQGDATMTKPAWKVEIGWVELIPNEDGEQHLQVTNERRRQSVPIETWQNRNDFPELYIAEPFRSITPADELLLGDPPEVKYCQYELKPFLRDSELALDWLRRRVESIQSPDGATRNSNGPGRNADELDEDDREILRWRFQGVKPKQIAIKLGRPTEGFSEVVKKLERKVKAQEYFEELKSKAKNGR
jgi:hypothetical protein